MKRLLLLFISVSAFAQSTYKLPIGITASDYMANTIIFKVKNVNRNLCNEQGLNIQTLQKSISSFGITNITKKFKNELPPKERTNKEGRAYADLSLIYECKFSGNFSIEKVINTLMSSDALIYAEPHFIPKVEYSPNDPQATPTLQYHLQTINAFNAWNINKGDTNVIIGITDTGTEPTHPDLGPNIKHNYADPIDLIDNDGDGYVDNFSGWDTGSGDNDPTWQPSPVGHHGIHVCGIASAATDNTVGVAGVGFKCKNLPVKIADANGNLIGAYEGIKYAADHNCKVINCSWGGAGGGQYGQDICTYATINKDALVVAAAGNNGLDMQFYPAAYEYVLSVANTDQNDAKNPSSNYGYFIDVCAPGTNINSTWIAGTYNNAQTGTSMASPVVAGAAGIVRSNFSGYTALQAGERLKITCDNIYAVTGNGPYANKLGPGRINLLRALTDPAAPSVVFYNIQVKDHNDSLFVSGDTLFIKGTFTNYLSPTSALSCTLVPLSAQAQAVVNTFNIGALNTLASVSNSATPFAFKLTGSFSTNTAMEFRLDMKDGAYSTSQFIVVTVNPDYINIAINDVATTSTGNGRIGYNKDNQLEGLGFVYGGVNELYDAGLMIGTSKTKVSDCVRGTGAGNDADFMYTTKIARVTAGPLSNFDAYTKFNDAPSTTTIGVEVDQRNFAWTNTADKKYVIWEYTIKNMSGAQIDSMFVGIFADWDIDDYSHNQSAYDATNKMGYSWCTDAGGKYMGIKLLTSSGSPVFYGIDNVSGGGGGVNISSNFPTNLKYQTLSTNRLTAGVTTTVTGNDVCNVMSSGPHSVLPNQYAVIAFALIAGNNLSDIQASAAAAQIKYNTVANLVSVKEISLANNSILVYPNPASNQLNVSVNNKLNNSVYVYDETGRLVHENKANGSFTINTTNWSRGIYFIKAINEEGVYTSKIVLN